MIIAIAAAARAEFATEDGCFLCSLKYALRADFTLRETRLFKDGSTEP